MQTTQKQWYTVLLVLAGILLLMVTFTSANGTGYTVKRWVVSGGGGESQKGGYVLRATAGQSAAGGLSGSGYVLNGGYWHGAVTSGFGVYLPLVLRNQ